jgi:hypothetical protein
MTNVKTPLLVVYLNPGIANGKEPNAAKIMKVHGRSARRPVT